LAGRHRAARYHAGRMPQCVMIARDTADVAAHLPVGLPRGLELLQLDRIALNSRHAEIRNDRGEFVALAAREGRSGAKQTLRAVPKSFSIIPRRVEGAACGNLQRKKKGADPRRLLTNSSETSERTAVPPKLQIIGGRRKPCGSAPGFRPPLAAAPSAASAPRAAAATAHLGALCAALGSPRATAGGSAAATGALAPAATSGPLRAASPTARALARPTATLASAARARGTRAAPTAPTRAARGLRDGTDVEDHIRFGEFAHARLSLDNT